MANQPTPIRPWIRLGSIRAPPPTPTPTTQPRPGQQSRPTFRGIAPTIQPQPTQPSEPPQSQAPPSPRATPPAAPAIPTVASISNVSSVPSSPVAGKVSAPSASLQTSPIQPAASPPRAVFTATTLSSVPSSPQVTTNVTSAPSPPVPKASGSLPASPTVSSVPSSTQAKVSSPLSSVQSSIPRAFPLHNSVPTSPVQLQRTAEAIQNSQTSASPRTMRLNVKTSPRSPEVKVTDPPPSPLTLPPSEKKTVVVQKTIEKPKSLHSGNGGDFMRSSSEVRKSAILRNNKKVSDSEDGIARIITLAGENKGAVMELIQSPKKHVFGSRPKNLLDNGNSTIRTVGDHGERNGSSSNNEVDNVKRKDKSHDGRTKASPPSTTYMNSNVQGVNHSIMYGAECKLNDPGVHFSLSRKPFSKELEHKERVIHYPHD